MDIYTTKDSLYFQNNPTWHVEDSAWKANKIIKMLKRNSLTLNTIAEVGCGVGEILAQLYTHLDANHQFFGFEISPDAFELAKLRVRDRIKMENKDIFDEKSEYDLLLIIDIFEHVENYFEFVRKTKVKVKYKIFHIPLDMNTLNVLRGTPISNVRAKVGHLHYFSKDTALATLRDTGHEILDYFYTPGMLETEGKGFKTKLINPLRKLFFSFNPDLAVRLLGGHSLMVLTK